MENKPKFICRCSSIGKLMTDPREKGAATKYKEAVSSYIEKREKYEAITNKGTKTAANLLKSIQETDLLITELKPFKDQIHLSKSAIGVVTEWMKGQLGYPVEQFSSKYTEKGILCEYDAIAFAAKYYGWGDVKKNTERKTNEYITGESDVVIHDRISDIKNSWSGKTFPLMDTDIPIDGYGYQGLGYLELWDKPLFQLTYVLMDAPEVIIDKEANRIRYELGMDEVDLELFEEVKTKHTYSHLHPELRIKSFYIERNSAIIESVYERVELCRKWIDDSGFYEIWDRTRKK